MCLTLHFRILGNCLSGSSFKIALEYAIHYKIRGKEAEGEKKKIKHTSEVIDKIDGEDEGQSNSKLRKLNKNSKMILETLLNKSKIK